MLQEIEEILSDVTSGKTASAVFGIFQGRCTFAAVCFSVAGIYGWLHGRDLTSYAAFVTAIQALLVLHSWKSDIHEQRCAALEMEKSKDGDTVDLLDACDDTK